MNPSKSKPWYARSPVHGRCCTLFLIKFSLYWTLNSKVGCYKLSNNSKVSDSPIVLLWRTDPVHLYLSMYFSNKDVPQICANLLSFTNLLGGVNSACRESSLSAKFQLDLLSNLGIIANNMAKYMFSFSLN